MITPMVAKLVKEPVYGELLVYSKFLGVVAQSEGTLVLGQPCGGGWPMRRRLSRAAKKKPHPKTKLGLPDLDQLMNSLMEC